MAEPLYSVRGQKPEPLPEKVRLLDSGLTVTTKNITPELLAQAGVTGPHEVPVDYNRNTHVCEWSPEDLAFVVREKKSYEMRNAVESAWSQLRADRNRVLTETDKRIMPWLEKGQPAPEPWQRYRQALRDLPQVTEDPFNVMWPCEPLPEAPAEEPAKAEAKPRQTRRRKTT